MTMMNDKLIEDVRNWGFDKGILRDPDNYEDLQQMRKAQATKTLEEVMELLEAIDNDNRDEVRDAIGDTIVTLIMVAELHQTGIYSCLNDAYHVIKNRTGKMVDGQFVKDE